MARESRQEEPLQSGGHLSPGGECFAPYFVCGCEQLLRWKYCEIICVLYDIVMASCAWVPVFIQLYFLVRNFNFELSEAVIVFTCLFVLFWLWGLPRGVSSCLLTWTPFDLWYLRTKFIKWEKLDMGYNHFWCSFLWLPCGFPKCTGSIGIPAHVGQYHETDKDRCCRN